MYVLPRIEWIDKLPSNTNLIIMKSIFASISSISTLIIATSINIMKKVLLILLATRLSRSFLALAVILSMLIQTSHGQEGVPYETIHKVIYFLKSKTIDGTKYSPLYIKSEKKFDFKKANFRLESKDGKTFKISFDILKEISINELTHEDIDRITKKFQIKMWIPKDLKKFKGHLLKHDLEKGSFYLSAGRNFSTKSIEEAREDYNKSLEKPNQTHPH